MKFLRPTRAVGAIKYPCIAARIRKGYPRKLGKGTDPCFGYAGQAFSWSCFWLVKREKGAAPSGLNEKVESYAIFPGYPYENQHAVRRYFWNFLSLAH